MKVAVLFFLSALMASSSCGVRAVGAETQPATGGELIRLSIPDAQVIDQNGRPRRFLTDLVRGRVVAVNFIFTGCSTVCPIMGANFGKLRESLDTCVPNTSREIF